MQEVQLTSIRGNAPESQSDFLSVTRKATRDRARKSTTASYFEELDAWKDELALQIPFNPGVEAVWRSLGPPCVANACATAKMTDQEGTGK